MALPPRLRWSGYLLGFAIGGFFDGILLHQVLQWHHLLSGLEGPAFRDLRVQILADGLFHVAMYVVALVGLFWLARSRHELGLANADRLLLASVLMGFGIWHIVDAVVFHWTMGIHRIRMQTGHPLLWDLAWFFVFGVAIAAGGLLLRRRVRDRPPGMRGRAAGLTVALITLGAGPLAALPPPGSGAVVVLFGPGATSEQMFDAFGAVNGGIVWADPSARVWVIEIGDDARAGALYRHGALLVSHSAVSIGCFSWLQVGAPGDGP